MIYREQAGGYFVGRIYYRIRILGSTGTSGLDMAHRPSTSGV